MTAQQTFTSRVNRKANPEKAQEASKVFMEIETRDDETNELLFSEGYTFSPPEDGRLLLLMSSFGGGGSPVEVASEVVATLRAMLSPTDFRKIRARIDGPEDRAVPIEDLVEIISILTEGWAEGFPTPPSSDSSPARRRTGGSSTESSRAKG